MSIARKILMGSSGGKKSTYVDDVFSTYLYKGTGSPQTITNGIDLAGEGGMTWIKSRNWTRSHNIYDTVRGTNKVIYTESTNAEVTKGPANQDSGIYQFNNNGFSIGAINGVGANGYDYSSWTFRKQKGFFDVVTYTGNGSNRTIAHNLGSVPGCIMIKRLDTAENWRVYHRGIGPDKILYLNLNSPEYTSTNSWNSTTPTSTVFSLGTHDAVNDNGATYVAYLFAGGASTAATAPSVDFNGSSYLEIADHSDFTFGTDDFTIEAWYKAEHLNLSNSWDYIFSSGWPVQLAHTVDSANTNSRFSFYMADSNSGPSYIVSDLHTGNGSVYAGQWYHVAVTRSGSTFRIFLNGELKNTATSSGSAPAPNANSAIGRFGPSAAYYAYGKISNFRYVKGTAVYTESFRPPTEPLTAITNTKLLCCNSSSVTGSTVTPGTITNNGATANTDSPFDDSEGFQFGKDEDQNIIKCGTYDGMPGSPNINVEIGWEPQFFMVKSATESTTEWLMWDSMRGIATDGNDERLSPTELSAEYGGQNAIDLTSTGVRIRDGDARVNGGNGAKLIYIAIRRPDGLVGKPPEAGTDVFAMDTGSGSAGIPVYDSGFPVDLALYREVAATSGWNLFTRLTSPKQLNTNNDSAAQSDGGGLFDSNEGWYENSMSSAFQSWMWKRHAGFDVVTYNGQNSAFDLPHSLGKTPEMIWFKSRSNAVFWYVYHKGLNGGTNPLQYSLTLNTNAAETNQGSPGQILSLTPSHIGLNFWSGAVSQNSYTYTAMLFASVAGISKLGNWVGDGGTQTITLGFQPRFLMFKTWNTGGGWYILDTRRGWGAGNDASLQIQETNAQDSGRDDGAPTATGFTVTGDVANEVGRSYIYYAHA